jgi:hypothetical protein
MIWSNVFSPNAADNRSARQDGGVTTGWPTIREFVAISAFIDTKQTTQEDKRSIGQSKHVNQG